MFKHVTQMPMIAKNLLPSPDNTSNSDSEDEIALELEQKRRLFEEEVIKFRSQKEKEFRDFENELRSARKRSKQESANRKHGQHSSDLHSKPQRTFSSSALDLLVGHGAHAQSTNGISPRKHGNKHHGRKDSQPKTGPLPSKPTLSLDSTNIKGETFPQAQPHVTAAQTSSSRILPRSSSSSSLASLATPKAVTTPPAKQELELATSNEDQETLNGLFLPAYLPLLDAKDNTQFPRPSPLITPPVEDVVGDLKVKSKSKDVALPNGIIPLQSSSYPPHVSILSAHSPATKRAYTAPLVSPPKMPSALRTASAGNLARKRKHVTFRLADQAIVQPSSSYEEGPSPDLEDDSSLSSNKKSGTRSPLRHTSSRSRFSIGARRTSDEEDEAAGVTPGMSMDEVMQKLNTLHMSEDGVEDEEDNGYIDTKYHEDDEDEDQVDEPMYAHGSEEEDNVDEDEDEDDDDDSSENNEPESDQDSVEEEESYFSPRARQSATYHPVQPHDIEQHGQQRRRASSSPLAPYRDANWSSLSSSDKDRLLFQRQTSDEEDSDKQAKLPSINRRSSGNSNGSERTNKRRSVKNRILTPGVPEYPCGHDPSIAFDDFAKSIERGGSNVGFFELDEELSTSAQPAESNMADSVDDFDIGNEFTKGRNTQQPGGDPNEDTVTTDKKPSDWRAAFAGTLGPSSVPIDIVRPSISVSSSWVGTFGH